jgi:hypothetical protein
VCVAFERRRVEFFSTSLETGLVCHGIRFSTLTIDESLSLRVGRRRRMDGEVGSVRLAYIELAILNRLSSVGDSYLEG